MFWPEIVTHAPCPVVVVVVPSSAPDADPPPSSARLRRRDDHGLAVGQGEGGQLRRRERLEVVPGVRRDGPVGGGGGVAAVDVGGGGGGGLCFRVLDASADLKI